MILFIILQLLKMKFNILLQTEKHILIILSVISSLLHRAAIYNKSRTDKQL